jgi:hypothetical protein
MTQIASNRMAALLAGVFAFGIAGCADDDDAIVDAAVDAPPAVPPDALPPDAPSDALTQDPFDPDAAFTCEARVAEADPTVSQACASCMCEECEAELEGCWDDDDCGDQMACSREAVADGTCPELTPSECLAEECDFELTDPAAALLLCLEIGCSDECVPVGEDADAGVDDDDDDDGIIENGIL